MSGLRQIINRKSFPPKERREALSRIQTYDPPRRLLSDLNQSTLREVVYAEAHRRTAEALTAWVTDPNPETRTTFIHAIQSLEVAQRALRVTEQPRPRGVA
jgi:hypothetical protein